MNVHNVIDQIEKIDPEVYDRFNGRRAALRNFASFTGKVALASIPLALGSMFKKAYSQSVPAGVIDVLKFALTLEYLEAEFYNKALAAPGLIAAGPATGAIQTIAKHENAHVAFLDSTIKALGGGATPKPTFDFSAGNGSGNGPFKDVFSNYDLFLAVSQVFEDTGVRAYKGQAGALISVNALLRAALQIHSVEARHAAHIREMRSRKPSAFVVGTPYPWITLNQSNVASPAVQASYDGEDATVQAGVSTPGLGGSNVSIDDATESFDEPLTKEQVLAIVDPFIV